MLYHLTVKSENVKTGPIPVTTSSKETCPSVCPLRGFCYAALGQMNFHWNKVTNYRRGKSFKNHLKDLSKLPDNQLLRLSQAGDLPGKGNRINNRKLSKLIKAGKNKRFFGYTHKLVEGKSFVAKNNRKYIKEANKNGLTINLSANNLSHADRLKELNIGPVVAILPLNSPNTLFTPKGNKVIKCPSRYKENVTCATCQLCQKQRNIIVGFVAHGSAKKKISQMAEQIS
jgi:hypothetical protein